MANEDSQSVNWELCDESHQLNSDVVNQSILPQMPKPISSNTKWNFRNSFSSASLRRCRSSIRRHMNMKLDNSQTSSQQSFPLFRRFYLMHNSLTRKRIGTSPNNSNESDTIPSSEKLHSALRIETSHILTTIFITLTSACLLILMVLLDFNYLNDAITDPINHEILTLSAKNNASLCFRYPKVCAMKVLVIFAFVVITIILCYMILTLYTRARRHSQLLERKTDELEKEKCLTEKLLHEILPPCIAKDLIYGRKVPAEYFESVTVYFSDIVGFTIIASMCSPNETCDMLNQLYSIFDSILENFDVYKVETIGDAYMVVSGAPKKNNDRHPNEIVNMSLALLQCKQQVRVPRTSAQLQLRIGIHTGSVCAAVIGSKMPRYCMFGDTVNVANRMESSGQPERIHLSEDTYQKLLNPEQYIFEERGEISIKGKGLMRTYFLLGKQTLQPTTRSRANTLSRSERSSR